MMFIPEMLAGGLTETGRKRSQMIKWYFDMFEYVAGYPGADRIIRYLLGPRGALERHNMLATRYGAELFLALSRANPGDALSFLDRLAGTITGNQS